MAKQILLYGQIWEYNAMYFFDQIKEAQEDDPEADLEVLINCTGGNPQYGMSIIRKVQEMASVPVIVEGMAHSMALFLLAYVDPENTSAIDTAQAVLHRASFGEWYEGCSGFKGSIDERILVKTNKDLEKAFRARVDVAALEALPQFTEKNLKLKDIFSLESREEVLLSAQDLKKLGLISKIIKVTPSRIEAVNKVTEAFASCKTVEQFKLAAQVTPKIAAQKEQEQTNEYMDYNELKTKYPALFAQVKQEGHAEGVTAGTQAEKDRIEAIMVFIDIDPKACKTAIESGKPLSAKVMAEMSLKAMTGKTLKDVEADSAEPVGTGAPDEKTKKQKELDAFWGAHQKNMGKPETKAA